MIVECLEKGDFIRQERRSWLIPKEKNYTGYLGCMKDCLVLRDEDGEISGYWGIKNNNFKEICFVNTFFCKFAITN
jgi:hypothetical protein